MLVFSLVPGEFSPHQRGCFLVSFKVLKREYVFPAPAGVFLGSEQKTIQDTGFPRTSGGVSVRMDRFGNKTMFSPHQRGCFFFCIFIHFLCKVFPAPAGVFPYKCNRSDADTSFPRTSGGVSRTLVHPREVFRFSPHQRGCFHTIQYLMHLAKVFPAPAGVFREFFRIRSVVNSFPRTSGGVSLDGRELARAVLFSPHQRGCF